MAKCPTPCGGRDDILECLRILECPRQDFFLLSRSSFRGVSGAFGIVTSRDPCWFVPNICRIITRWGVGVEIDGSSVCRIVTHWGFVVAGARLPVQPSSVILGG